MIRGNTPAGRPVGGDQSAAPIAPSDIGVADATPLAPLPHASRSRLNRRGGSIDQSKIATPRVRRCHRSTAKSARSSACRAAVAEIEQQPPTNIRASGVSPGRRRQQGCRSCSSRPGLMPDAQVLLDDPQPRRRRAPRGGWLQQGRSREESAGRLPVFTRLRRRSSRRPGARPRAESAGRPRFGVWSRPV